MLAGNRSSFQDRDLTSPVSTEGTAKPRCRCGGKTVYYRAYNGESLCKGCFTNSILEKTVKTISRYSMLKYGDKVGVAVSGGKDSTSLLHVLNEVTRDHGTKLYAITIDEGIEGYRQEAVTKSEELAEKLGVPLLVASYKEFFGFTLDEALSDRSKAKTQLAKASSCAVCGPLRRRSIDLAAERLGVDVVATAHNLDDVLQTFFINLYAGDFDRIRWLDPSRNRDGTGYGLRRIKPFLEVYEQELAFFAYLNGLSFQSESCPYMNEGIRTEIRQSLNTLESRHPGVKYSTLKTVLAIARGLGSGKGARADFGLTEREDGIKLVRRCEKCGKVSSGDVCSVCQTVELISTWRERPRETDD